MKYTRACIMELIGTFFLTFVLGLSTGNPFAIGFILMALVYTGGHISGAHYNWAVSVGASVRGVFSWNHMPLYLICQALGALLGAMGVYGFVGPEAGFLLPMGAELNWYVLFAIEFLMTLIFIMVWLTVITAPSFDGNQIFGFVIGLGFAAIVFLGGLYNPAVGLGTILCGLFTGVLAAEMIWHYTLVYVVAPLLGACIGASLYRFMNPDQNIDILVINETIMN